MRCFFIGHRDTGPGMMPQIRETVRRHIAEFGVTEFVVGQYGAFDRMAARAVIDAKKEAPAVRLTILLPYHPAERLVQAPEGWDGTFYPPGMESVPRRYAIVHANRYMVRHSDYLIACAWRPAGSAKQLVEYAKRRNEIVVTELLPGT